MYVCKQSVKLNTFLPFSLQVRPYFNSIIFCPLQLLAHPVQHGLRTTNEGINQRNLKIWADVAKKYASAVPKNLGVGVDFRPCSEGDFLTGRP